MGSEHLAAVQDEFAMDPILNYSSFNSMRWKEAKFVPPSIDRHEDRPKFMRQGQHGDSNMSCPMSNLNGSTSCFWRKPRIIPILNKCGETRWSSNCHATYEWKITIFRLNTLIFGGISTMMYSGHVVSTNIIITCMGYATELSCCCIFFNTPDSTVCIRA